MSKYASSSSATTSSVGGTTRTRRRRLPECCQTLGVTWMFVELCFFSRDRDATRRAGSGLPVVQISGTARGKRFSNPACYDHIRVLLIKTNSMIYICYIKYGGKIETCELGVGDDELTWETTRTRHRRLPREGARDHVVSRLAGSGLPGEPVLSGAASAKKFHNFVISLSYLCSPHKNKFNGISYVIYNIELSWKNVCSLSETTWETWETTTTRHRTLPEGAGRLVEVTRMDMSSGVTGPDSESLEPREIAGAGNT